MKIYLQPHAYKKQCPTKERFKIQPTRRGLQSNITKSLVTNTHKEALNIVTSQIFSHDLSTPLNNILFLSSQMPHKIATKLARHKILPFFCKGKLRSTSSIIAKPSQFHKKKLNRTSSESLSKLIAHNKWCKSSNAYKGCTNAEATQKKNAS